MRRPMRVELPEPPSLERYLEEGGTWSVGADVSPDDWNALIVGDGPAEGRVGRACGEPPVPYDFLVGREALERLGATGRRWGAWGRSSIERCSTASPKPA